MTLLLDLTHTSHSRARSGVQRVVRALWRELGAEGAPITFDPFEQVWRPLDPWEIENLASSALAASRKAHWPLGAQLRGRWRRWRNRPGPHPGVRLPGNPRSDGLIVPEILTAAAGRALPALLRSVAGPRVALFHDALALQFPEYTPAGTVARFPSYLQELLLFDGVAAVSDASRTVLQEYWNWLGVSRRPVLATLPLGIDPPRPLAGNAAAGRPVILCVSTLEGRKNHEALLEACAVLWAAGSDFELRLIGLANPETGVAALERIRQLQRAGRPVRYDGPVDEASLEAAYAECRFTVYPSIAEGFGLPVAESLLRGKPCLCRFEGALGELAAGGGCRSLGQGSAPEIARAIATLLQDQSAATELAAAAGRRTFRSWSDYSAELQAWAKTLPHNA